MYAGTRQVTPTKGVVVLPERLSDDRIRVPLRVTSDDGVIGDGSKVIDSSDPQFKVWSDYLDIRDSRLDK